jgi:TolB-like protein/Tfp pilus assembly protein PilF
MGDDEEWTLRVYRHFRTVVEELVTAWHGRVFGAAGDSFMAEFKNPVEAVQCAEQIQQAVDQRCAEFPEEPELRFRLGLNMGEVMVSGDDLFGDDVNISARIQEMAGSGGITLSETVYNHVFDKLDLKFEFLGERRFKNIASPVRVYQALLKSKYGEATMPRSSVDVSKPVPGFSGRPAIAVLPFTNLSAEPDAEYIADGLTEDIIAGLSRLRWFPLIARNSSFVYRGKPISVVRIGQSLGARYLVDGTLRVIGDRMRVTSELIDTDSGTQIWTETYDRRLDDIFEVQTDIARRIIATLDPAIDRLEQWKSSQHPPEELDTWGRIRRGLWHLNRFTRDDAARAKELFEQVLRDEPNSGEAQVQLAIWYFWDIWARRGGRDEWQKMATVARRALVADEHDPRPHWLIGIAQIMSGQPKQARGPLSKALALNPSQYGAYVGMGTSYILSGEAEKAIEPLRTGLRLSPHDPYTFHSLGELAQANHMLERWDDGIAYAEESIRLHPRYWYAHVLRICCLSRKGEADDAREAYHELMQQRPDFSRRHIRWVPFLDQHWNEYMIDGLQLAAPSTSETAE